MLWIKIFSSCSVCKWKKKTIAIVNNQKTLIPKEIKLKYDSYCLRDNTFCLYLLRTWCENVKRCNILKVIHYDWYFLLSYSCCCFLNIIIKIIMWICCTYFIFTCIRIMHFLRLKYEHNGKITGFQEINCRYESS